MKKRGITSTDGTMAPRGGAGYAACIMTEEGLGRMHTGKIKVNFNPPVVMGVVACTTPET